MIDPDFHRMKQLLKDQTSNEENKRPSPVLSEVNELKPLNSPDCETVALEKFKLEVEQRVNNEGERLVKLKSISFSSRNISKNS